MARNNFGGAVIGRPGGAAIKPTQKGNTGIVKKIAPWAQPKVPVQVPAKGQGKGKSSQGQKADRQRVVSHRVTGTVAKWKETFGWILPDSPVDHHLAKKNGGRIYVKQDDLEQPISGEGDRVSFFVYCDHAGLGAQNVIAAKDGQVAPAKQAAKKGEGKGKAAKKDGEEAVKNSGPPNKEERESLAEAGQGVIVDWHNEVGWVKPDDEVEHPDGRKFGRRKGLLFVHSSDVDGELPLINAQVMYSMYKDSHGLGAEAVTVLEQGDGVKPPKEPKEPKEPTEGGEDGEGKRKRNRNKNKDKDSLVKNDKLKKGKGKGKGSKEDKGPCGPNLARERLSDVPLTGEVIFWKGTTGWIKTSDSVDHPDASKRGGKLYAHIQDVLTVEEGQKPEKGATVQFYLFKDESGLGCEEINLL